MADKRLRLIVEAVTSQAQAALRSFGNTIRGTSEQAARDLEKPTKAAQTMGNELGTLAMAATVALATIGIHYAKMAAAAAFNLAETAAKNLEVGEGFRDVANRMGVSANDLVKRLQDAARGTVGAYQTMGLAVKALDLGIGASTDDLVKLMQIAHVRAKRYGMSTAEAFQLLIDGISSGRPMMLRHLGFLADTEKAYEAVARSMGKEADELTLLQQKQAVYQAILQTGQSDVEAWIETADDASDAFERQRVATQKLRQEIGEMLLPTMSDLAEKMSTLPTIIDQLGYTFGVFFAGLGAGFKELAENPLAAIFQKTGYEAFLAAERTYAAQDAARKVNAEWGQMYGILDQARKGLLDTGDAADTTGQDLDELGNAVKKAGDIWGDYARSVAQQNWQMTQRVADAQFSMTQAAQSVAFDLYKIERDSAARRSDLVAAEDIRNEAETAKHYANLRYMKQDLNDALADMDWNYEQERKDLLDKAPWWVRNAMGKELYEQGEGWKEKLKAVDPAYAKELEKLEKQHKHEEKIEKRESRQALDRAKDDWNIQQREQDRAMDQQLFELERDLGYQREEWAFSAAQREETERNSMANIVIEHEHSLSMLWETTQRKLAELPPLYEQAGYNSWMALLQGFNNAQSQYGSTPAIPGYNPFENWTNPWATAQKGMEYVPRTMPVMVHKGESILPAPAAQQWREGNNITINVNVGGGWTPYQGHQVAQQISNQLGQSIRRNTR